MSRTGTRPSHRIATGSCLIDPPLVSLSYHFYGRSEPHSPLPGPPRVFRDTGGMDVLEIGALEQPLADALATKYQPLLLPAESQRKAFLEEHGQGITIAVVAGPPGFDADLMRALPRLGAIVNYGDGFDLIDVDEARRLGIGISNTPGVLTDSVADTAVGLLLMTMRSFVAADRYVRAGRWPVEGPFPLTQDVSRTRIGILGLGRIGTAIASRLAGFGCAIGYYNRHEVSESPYRYAASPIELAEWADALVVSVSGGKSTSGLVSRQVLEALGQQSYLVNVARGSVVDQDALVEFLVRGSLAGAGLDVYANQPYVPDQLRNLNNVVLLPHVGSATTRTRSAMAALVLENLDQYLTHGTLTTPVVQPKRSPPSN